MTYALSKLLFRGIHEICRKKIDGGISHVGYFNDAELATNAVEGDRGYEAIWASLNPLSKVPPGFQLNQLQPSPNRSTKDWYKVFVFDVKTLKITTSVRTADDSDSIIYDPASKHIFAFNGDSKTASVIDPASASLVKNIDTGGGPEFAVADNRGTVFNNLEDTNEVVAIDSNALTIKSRWRVAPAGTPTALAMDREHRRLFSAGRKPQMVVMMDADSGKVLQSMSISAGADAATFENTTGLLFVSTREGKLHIFHEDSPTRLSEVATLKTEYGAKTMALDTKTHNLYLSTAEFAPAGSSGRGEPKPGTFHLLIYGR